MPSFGLSDGPAMLPVACVYTGNLTPPVTFKTICPSGQTQSASMPSPGSACDYSTYTAALEAVNDGCGIWYIIKSTTDGTPGGTQNEYKEPGSVANIPDGRACTASTWNWVTTDQYTGLPPAGQRITPAWIGVPSLAGYPAYAQPAVAGTYVPKLATKNINTGALGWCGSAAYWRFMGLEITSDIGTSDSAWLIGTLPSGAGSCASNFGGDHLIFDRILVHGQSGTWNSMQTGHVTKWGVRFNGTYNALINSYCADFLLAESHCVAWGVGLTTQPQGPTKIYNNLLSASDEDLFTGGGPQSVVPEDAEIRQNHMFKPMYWDALCFTPLPSFCGGQYYASGGDGAASRTSGVVTFTVSTLYPQSPAFGATDTVHVAGCSDTSFNTTPDNATVHLTGVSGTAPNYVLTWNQAGGDASGVTCAVTDKSNAPQVKNAMEMKNQDRALIEGNVFDHSWEGQSDQVGELFVLNTIGGPTDTSPAVVTNITSRYNLMVHGNYCIQLGNEVVITSTSLPGIGQPPVAPASGQLANLSIHDNLCDDINGAYYDISGSGLNSIGMRNSVGYPNPIYPNAITVNHNTFIQSFVASTHPPGGIGGSKLYGMNDFSVNNFNVGTVSTAGTAVTLACTFTGTYEVGCDNFATQITSPNTSCDWIGLNIWIAGLPYAIASCIDSTHLTLTTSAGTQSNAVYWAPCDSSQRTCSNGIPPALSLWPSQIFTNNIGVGGITAASCTAAGTTGAIGCYWNNALGTAYSVAGNIFVTNQWAGQVGQSPYPAGNQTTTNLSNIIFANYTDGDVTGANDYHICTGAGVPVSGCGGASPFIAGGTWPTTDNLPPGANVDLVKQHTQGVQ
jgi:hypothetical protein